MLAYDKKQISRIHRILIPAVIFTAAVLLGRMDTIMADFGQSEPLAAGKALGFAFESLTTGNALLVAPVICAFPYGAACIDEVKSGMFKNVLYRTDKASYIHSKAAACMLSGAVTGMRAFPLSRRSLIHFIYFNQPVTCCITLWGNGLKWTRTTDLTLIRRAL